MSACAAACAAEVVTVADQRERRVLPPVRPRSAQPPERALRLTLAQLKGVVSGVAWPFDASEKPRHRETSFVAEPRSPLLEQTEPRW